MSPEAMVLDRVTRVPGVRGALLASAGDGLVVAEQLMDGVDGRAPASAAAGLESPLFVHLRAEEGSLLAAPATGDLVLVAMVGPDANIGLARLEMLDAAGRLG